MQNLLTCISCRVAFNDADLQRDHYKSEWHRYNLKRKIAELPPITLENFDNRITEQKINEQKSKTDKEECNKYCDICLKSFSSSNSYESHLRSKRHKDLEAGIGKDTRKANARDNRRMRIKALERKQKKSESNMDTGGNSKETSPCNSDSEEEFEGLGLEQCLFCENIGDSLEDNLKHMTLVHSFFLPDADYISDLEGLINYLGLKIAEGHMCLWCNETGKMFQSILAAQRHMVDKGHCKILHDGDTLIEFADFYDYRSSYPDYKERGSGDEEDDDEEGDDEDDNSEDQSTNDVDDEEYQLVLPSGASIGHRSLMRYYKQKLKVTNDKLVNTSKMSRVLSQYKALGWTGTTGKVAERRAKDIQYVERTRNKYRMKMGMKNNKLLTAHFRNQVFCYF